MTVEASITGTAVPRQDWRGFALVAFALGLTQLGFYFTTSALPLYLHDLGVPQSRIGFEVGLGSIATLALTVFVGPGINRLGSRFFLAAGGLVYVSASLGMWLLPHEATVSAFRALQGAGTAVMGPSAMTLGARLISGRRATAVSLMGSSNSLALAVGPALGLTLYGRYGAVGLFLPACVAAALGLVSTIFLPNMPREQRVRGFGFDRVWLPSLIANLLGAVYFGGVLAYLPLDLHHVHGPNAGIFFTADAIGVLLFRAPTGMLADRHGSLLPKICGLVVTFGGLAALALPPSVLTLVLGGAGTGIGGGLFITGIMADLATRSTGSNRGTAMAMSAASLNAGFFAGSALSGLLIGPGGFDAVLLLGGLTTLAAVPFALTGGGARAQTAGS